MAYNLNRYKIGLFLFLENSNRGILEQEVTVFYVPIKEVVHH
jgi:hypothetical protein